MGTVTRRRTQSTSSIQIPISAPVSGFATFPRRSSVSNHPRPSSESSHPRPSSASRSDPDSSLPTHSRPRSASRPVSDSAHSRPRSACALRPNSARHHSVSLSDVYELRDTVRPNSARSRRRHSVSLSEVHEVAPRDALRQNSACLRRRHSTSLDEEVDLSVTEESYFDNGRSELVMIKSDLAYLKREEQHELCVQQFSFCCDQEYRRFLVVGLGERK